MILDKLFPGWALKRAIAKRRLANIQALYEAGRDTRTHPLRGYHAGPDETMQFANVHLRRATRDLDENHDLAIGVLDDLVNWVIGAGLTIEPMAALTDGSPALEYNAAVKVLWDEWSQTPDTTQETPLGELERLIARSVYRDGEVLVRHIVDGRISYPTAVPYAIEVLEADYLPFEHGATTGPTGTRIIQGVEKNNWGRPIAYHIWREHPHDFAGRSNNLFTGQDLKRIPAAEIMHIKFVRRLRQTRGVPVLHGVIHRIQDIKDIEEFERVAAKTDASLAAFVRNMPGLGRNVSRDGDVHREQEMESGGMMHLYEGEAVDIHTPKRPNAQLEAFREGQIRMVAAGTLTRYSSISRNYNGTYSAQRQELVEGDMNYCRLRNYLIGVFYRPMYQRWIEAAMMGAAIPGRVLRGVDRSTLARADYRGPPMPWIDPVKELDARQGAVEAGFVSRQQVIRDMGNDPAMVDAQREADAELTETEQTEETEGQDNDAGVQSLVVATHG